MRSFIACHIFDGRSRVQIGFDPISSSRLRQQEIWVRDYLHTNVTRTQHCLRNSVGNCCVRLHVATVLRRPHRSKIILVLKRG